MSTEKQNQGFPIERILKTILDKSKEVSNEDKNLVQQKISEAIRNKPFKVAVIGQSGVGKSSTLNSLFGITADQGNVKIVKTAAVEEGTKVAEEKIYPIKDGFSISITDMPGLNNDIIKDEKIYIPLYQKILPECDLILYIIDATSKAVGLDIKILQDVVIPVCKRSNKTQNIVLAINKIDAIGESHPEYKTNPEYAWNVEENIPTETLKKLITERISQIYDQLINTNTISAILEDNNKSKKYDVSRFPFYSALYAYNMNGLLEAILASDRGFIFVGTVAQDVVKKWSSLKQ